MRDQYNVVNDKVVDSISEFELFQKKINVANIRLTNILLSFITLSIQISYYAIQGLLYLLYNKNRLEALENGKSDSNKKLVTNNADGLNIANTNAYVPNIANNNGPILAIEDESDSNKKLVTNNANEIDELTANFENLNLKNKQ